MYWKCNDRQDVVWEIKCNGDRRFCKTTLSTHSALYRNTRHCTSTHCKRTSPPVYKGCSATRCYSVGIASGEATPAVPVIFSRELSLASISSAAHVIVACFWFFSVPIRRFYLFFCEPSSPFVICFSTRVALSQPTRAALKAKNSHRHGLTC